MEYRLPEDSCDCHFHIYGPFDRFPANNDRTRNHHVLSPYTVTIKAGGAVNFIISGVHHILIYAPGTTLDSIARKIIEGESR